MGDLGIEVRPFHGPEAVLVEVNGALDATTIDGLLDTVDGLRSDEPRQIVLDLSRLRELNAFGATPLINYIRQLRRRGFADRMIVVAGSTRCLIVLEGVPGADKVSIVAELGDVSDLDQAEDPGEHDDGEWEAPLPRIELEADPPRPEEVDVDRGEVVNFREQNDQADDDDEREPAAAGAPGGTAAGAAARSPSPAAGPHGSDPRAGGSSTTHPRPAPPGSGRFPSPAPPSSGRFPAPSPGPPGGSGPPRPGSGRMPAPPPRPTSGSFKAPPPPPPGAGTGTLRPSSSGRLPRPGAGSSGVLRPQSSGLLRPPSGSLPRPGASSSGSLSPASSSGGGSARPRTESGRLRSPSSGLQLAAWGPAVVAPRTGFVLSIFFFEEAQRTAMEAQARSGTNPEDAVLGRDAPTAAGAKELLVTLDLPGFELAERHATVAFGGEMAAASFLVGAPAAPGVHRGLVRVVADGIPIDRLRVKVTVDEARDDAPRQLPEARGRVGRIFACFEREDRSTVLAFKRAAEAAGIQVDVDVISRRRSAGWSESLIEEIPARDMLCLFWSEASSRSGWVDREWRAAIARKGPAAIHPVPLDDLSRLPLPADLAVHSEIVEVARAVAANPPSWAGGR